MFIYDFNFTALGFCDSIDKISMGFVGPYSHALYHSISSATIFSIARIYSKKSPWGTDKYIMDIILIVRSGLFYSCAECCLALLLQLYQKFGVGFVEFYKRAVSLIANLFIGCLLFKEPMSKFKVIRTVLVLFATLLILDIF